MSEAKKNPWILKTGDGSPSVPDGTYGADFVGTSDFIYEGEAKCIWSWKVASGPMAGKIATAMTGYDMSLKNLAGQLFSGLIGRQMAAGDDVAALLAGCAGKRYLIGISKGPQGGRAQVRTVLPFPTGM